MHHADAIDTMNILNIHERQFPVQASELGTLIDALASDHDALWPKEVWPRIRFDRALDVGATGGHGAIGYIVEEYRPSQIVKFRFLSPRGFEGVHWLEVIEDGENNAILRHTINMQTNGLALLLWLIVIRPLHDALLEDALAKAQASMGITPIVRPWSRWVRFLRWSVSRGRARRQQTPKPRVHPQ